MQKIKKIIISTFILFVAIFAIIDLPTTADVGDFESYDSSSWSSSDWDSSSWDYDSDWGSSSGGFYYFGGGFGGFIVFLIVMIIITVITSKYNKTHKRDYAARNEMLNNTQKGQSKEEIEKQILAQDTDFNTEEFLTWARDLFVKLQYAWSDRDWEAIRCFETPELFEQHSTQLKRYKQNGQINKIERVSVNWAKLFKFERNLEQERLTIALNSKMIDYIISETTGAVLKGDKNSNKINTYLLTFVRKSGSKTEKGKQTDTMNCPNCGAPTEITSSGKCPYCGSVITTRDHGWSLANLERYNGIMY